ncbi:hypothetical protein MIC97_06450 [Aquamicrobium sp. NLF2-7]|uniref:hypothetical protein n=1 Tax=Aquamicrobium sp. NLF2-7 TaxID=2918753 RepID=UPI001EFB2FF4|nr:hypothetical protein [Aquamicrobium sp. NLF2-7]MCG8271150.1 hypothetical protein [Aquamicrobium sp. NLF2-7]
MKLHDIARLGHGGKVGGKALLLRLDLDQSRFHASRGDAVGNGIDDVLDLPVDGCQPLVDLLPLLPRLCHQAATFGMVFG